jgi:release factor glutamine methyltransferase
VCGDPPNHLSFALSKDSTFKKKKKNQTPIDPLVASLARPLSGRLEHSIDILVFNPPYVPTSDDEVDAAQHGAGIAGSWAGGSAGMQVTDALLSQVDVGVSLFVFFFHQYPVIAHAHAHVVYL